MANHVAPTSDFIYDVFLSFRGGTRYSFTDHLYRALLRHGINAFRDDQNLRIGDEIGPSLLDAIEASRISMVVLCQDYASYTWCLDELVKIVDCYENKGKPVSAIFYKVEPSDVRHQKNSYKSAMIKHEKRFGKHSEKVKAWRSVLSRVCALSGEHCRDDMYESEIIEKIVKDTSAKLPPMPLRNKHVVGLDSHVEKVKSFISIESNDTICMLGIYGAGGIGKTELARDLYDRIRHHFEAASFLQNVREQSNKNSINGLENLQMILLSEMHEETEIKIGSTFKGGCEIKRTIGHKRVLLVLDDVDSTKQLESLAGGYDWFGSGSRIIVTTRDTSVLDKHVMDGVIIQKYKMEELNDHDSLKLFCWHAFNDSVPPKDFASVSSRALSYARGFPLALKVIGSNLNGGSVEEWETELDKYIPNAEIQDVLEISYNSLSELDKKIFLDIACFFRGERWEYVKRILRASDLLPVIRVFVSKCLITIDENGCLEMHDLIQEMGREIVRKESPSNPSDRSRLWSHEEVIQVLKENLGSSTIEGILLDPPKHKKIDHWTTTAFEKMKNLRILIIRNTIFSKEPSFLPNSLRLLDWKGYPSKSFPSHFCPYKIVDFKLPQSFLILEKPFQTFEDLTFINLSQCQSITLIPDLSRVKNLRVLTVDRCHKLARFDKSVGFMPNLVYLSALECTKLRSFVPRMYLPSLEILLFNFCRRLEHFPDVMQKMDKPLKIHMINTAIKEFPKSICNLTGLEYIDLSICKGLKDLSSSFLLLPKLITLKIDGCSQLQESFERFKESHSLTNAFPNLVTLYFGEANLSDEDLNVILEIFPKLEDLKVSKNNFASLSKCIKRSSHLKYLDVSCCKNLIEIPELPLSIQKVNARYCQSLTTKASSGLWFKVVSKEIERIQVVLPNMEIIPKGFDCVCNEGIPHFWARRKFPIVALAFMFGKVNDKNEIKKGVSELVPTSGKSHIVGLHLFIDGKEVCRKDYHYCTVGEHHMLLCDLRVLFNDEEWQGLDACLGDNWKAIQVQCESHLILSRWGVYVYEQKTNTDDIRFSFPNSANYMPSSCLVPKTTPQQSEQKTRHATERCCLRELLGSSLPDAESIENGSIINIALKYWWDLKANNRGEVSVLASEYGASLKREHEDSAWDVIRYLEVFKENIEIKRIAASWPEYIQYVSQRVELWWRLNVKYLGKEWVDIQMDIVLEACHFKKARGHRRYWGTLEMNLGDPAIEAVAGRASQLLWELLYCNKDREQTPPVILLKCQCLSTEDDSSSTSGHGESSFELEDPELQAFMMRIEEDVMRMNKTCGKLKASIVTRDFLVSEEYAHEIGILIILAKVGLEGFIFQKTSYGKLRLERRFTEKLFVLFWKLIFSFFLLVVIFCRVSIFDPLLLKQLLFVGMFLFLPYVPRRKPGRTVG